MLLPMGPGGVEWTSFNPRGYDMKSIYKTAMVASVAALSLGLAACDSAAENAAEATGQITDAQGDAAKAVVDARAETEKAAIDAADPKTAAEAKAAAEAAPAAPAQ